ncbi:recombinase family protein [Streptacidiphilus sp. EB103A]|uniref:recombinase family protein n=1 Tax=Streptacidiphilus sp. EB103A TaxID=3156275 RepID=UPI0035146A4D
MTTPTVWDDFEVPLQARRGQVTLNLHDHLAAYVPKRPAAYLRISSDRFGLEAGVDRQQEDADDARRRLRWPEFAQTYKENDTSAFKKRKVIKDDGSVDWIVIRPKFRQLLADLASGVIDGVIFYDLDRLVRRPRDLEDLIDIVEYVKRPVLGATGGHMNLINDSDRHMARIMCVMALKSSEDTSRRVARMHLACAQDGKIQGRIAYGWIRKGANKGTLEPSEANLVSRIFKDCLTGETAYSIATALNREGVKPPEAKSWSSTMINKMLRNPRYAGMVSYAGLHRVVPASESDGWTKVLFDDKGRPLLGSWVPIISPQDWSQVQFELQLRRSKRGLPPGRTRPGITNKYLMSGIFRCGSCRVGLVGHPGNKGESRGRTYRCPPLAHGGCSGVRIDGEVAEKAVEMAMDAFLTKLFETPDIAALVDPAHVAALHSELDSRSERKRELIRRWAEGTLSEVGLDEDDYFHMLSTLNRKISTLRDLITTAEDGPSRTVPKDDLIANWHNGTLQQRRSVLKRYLHGIDVLPLAGGAAPADKAFSKDRLIPRWKTPEEVAA